MLGIVENMSTFVCPDCGSANNIFDTGGGEHLAGEFDLPLLGRLPLDPSVREPGEVGEPIVLEADDETASAFGSLAENTMDGLGEVRRRSHQRTAKRMADKQTPDSGA